MCCLPVQLHCRSVRETQDYGRQSGLPPTQALKTIQGNPGVFQPILDDVVRGRCTRLASLPQEFLSSRNWDSGSSGPLYRMSDAVTDPLWSRVSGHVADDIVAFTIGDPRSSDLHRTRILVRCYRHLESAGIVDTSEGHRVVGLAAFALREALGSGTATSIRPQKRYARSRADLRYAVTAGALHRALKRLEQERPRLACVATYGLVGGLRRRNVSEILCLAGRVTAMNLQDAVTWLHREVARSLTSI